MSSVHAADDSAMGLLCWDRTSPAAPLRSSDSELQYLYPETADKLFAVPVIKTWQLLTQKGNGGMTLYQ